MSSDNKRSDNKRSDNKRSDNKRKSVPRREIIKAAVGGSVATATAMAVGPAFAGRKRRCHRDVIERDVCVIGGGSAGTYAAVRLRDAGLSVAVVERQSRLGGHAQTYFDPTSGVPINIGVIVFENVPLVTEYFARFGATLVPAQFDGGQTAYVDYCTGKLVRDYQPTPPAEFINALISYRQILATDYPFLDDGFALPNPIPKELTRPFADFVKNRGLEGLFPTAYQFAQGLGETLANPALYVLKNFSAAVVDSLLGTGFVTAPNGVTELYDNIAATLGDEVLYDARVEDVDRKHGKIRVEVDTPEGDVTIVSRKLVVACPPTSKNLCFLDVDHYEKSIFDKFGANHYSTAVAELSGLPPDLSIQNVGANTRFNLPVLPGIYGISPTGAPNLWNVKVGSGRPLTDRQARELISSSIERIRKAGTYSVKFKGLRTFANHSPFTLMVDGNDIARGFYDKLNGLQGRNNTFYTGATFQTHDSSLIWRFTESLLPKITA